MNTLLALSILALISTIYGVAFYIDKKLGTQFFRWLNGDTCSINACSQPSQRHVQKENTTNDTHDLKQRIQVLEKLVSEPAYELNKKINQL